MSIRIVKVAAAALAGALALSAGTAAAQGEEAQSLEQLLEFVKIKLRAATPP